MSESNRKLLVLWDEQCPGWWKKVDVMSTAWDEGWVTCILERRLAAADYFGRPYPDEEDVLMDSLREEREYCNDRTASDSSDYLRDERGLA